MLIIWVIRGGNLRTNDDSCWTKPTGESLSGCDPERPTWHWKNWDNTRSAWGGSLFICRSVVVTKSSRLSNTTFLFYNRGFFRNANVMFVFSSCSRSRDLPEEYITACCWRTTPCRDFVTLADSICGKRRLPLSHRLRTCRYLSGQMEGKERTGRPLRLHRN